MSGPSLDRGYQDRISKAIAEALVSTSIDKDSGVAVLRSGEIVGALIGALAFAMAGSDVTRSPTATRVVCEEIARRLRRQIAAVKEMQTSGKLDFLRIVDADDVATARGRPQ